MTTSITIPPRKTKGEETRRRIAEAALTEFKRVGVDNAVIGDIAEIAGVSRPTFYSHFPSKQHILLELQRSLEIPIGIVVEDADDLQSALQAVVRGIMRARKKVGDIQLFSDMMLIYTKGATDLPVDDQPLLFSLNEKFMQGKKNGQLRKHIEPAQAVLLYLTSVFGYLIGPGQFSGDKDCETALRQISKLFLKD